LAGSWQDPEKQLRREWVSCPTSRRYLDLVNFTSNPWQVAPHANLSDRTRPVRVNVLSWARARSRSLASARTDANSAAEFAAVAATATQVLAAVHSPLERALTD